MGLWTDLCPRINDQPTTVTLKNITPLSERHFNSIINTSPHARGTQGIFSGLGIKRSDHCCAVQAGLIVN